MDEEALFVTGKRKGKEKRKKDGKKNLDVSKVKCFICHMKGHFSSHYPDRNKKSNTQMDGYAEVEEFNKNFDEDFCLIALHGKHHRQQRLVCGQWSILSYDRTKEVHQGLAGRWIKPPHRVDVLYVPRLTKNLISVSTLEDKGFQVKF